VAVVLHQPVTARAKTLRQALRRDEHGFALVYLALVLVVLMIFAALAVDIGMAKEAKASLQAAVDSAALTGAQVLNTTAPTQAQAVFDAAATDAYKSISILSGGQTAATTGSCGTHCDDYKLSSGGIAYDVQVTTPYTGPGELTPDQTLLNVKSCYGVPTTFGNVVGWRSIPICSSATAQNGTGSGGPTNSGCGSTDEFNNVTNTFNAADNPTATPPVNHQTISATYHSTLGIPVDMTSVHFVVQTQYGDLVQIPEGPSGVGVAGQSYSVTPGSGTDVTFSYTLPTTIDTSPDFTNTGTIGTNGIYSNTFTANLQVIDQVGRNCGDASWTTCNPPRNASSGTAHDPILDGGASGDVGTDGGWGTQVNGHDTTDDTSGDEPAGVKNPFTGSTATMTSDGHDVASDEYVQTRDPQTTPVASDSDDTITPKLGQLVTAGWPVGAIYNDEQPLKPGSVSFLVDGVVYGYNSAFSGNSWTLTDPSNVWLYPPSNTGVPSPIVGMPSFGTVSTAVSTVSKSGATGIVFHVNDAMAPAGGGTPMAGESVTATGVEPSAVTPPASTVAALNGSTGTYTIASKPNGTYTYTFAYAPTAGAPSSGTGTFNVSITWNGGSISTATLGASGGSPWPNVQHDTPPGGGPAGGSVGIMFDTANLVNGWHSAVVWANDGDVTTSGGDCGMATWVFGTTGGAPGPGTLHLIT
jgi:Flp pilus assembly protein TadG